MDPEKSWLSRNWKWFIPTGCVTLILLGVTFVIGFMAMVMGAVKSSDAYKLAVARVRASPAVVSELGQPIETGWMVSGSINVSGSSGDADISIPISGPKKSGTIYAVATKSAGVWTFTVLQVEVEGGSRRIDILTEGRENVVATPSRVRGAFERKSKWSR
jgi:hypothetical protein